MTAHPYSSQHLARKRLSDLAKERFATRIEEHQLDVVFGLRWPFVTRSWISFGDTTSVMDQVETTGPRRPQQDERITVNLTVGAWCPIIDGDTEAAELASAEAAHDLLVELQQRVRTDVTLDGAVQWCQPGSSETFSPKADQPHLNRGRLTEIHATFVCAHRFTT